jgi:transcription elongation factor GreB
VSRAFVKDDAPQDELIVPPRAPLPPGVANYVTPRGLARLRAERDALEAERAGLDADRSDEAERTRALSLNAALQAQLARRLSSAKVIDPHTQPPDEVRFGATVTLRTLKGERPGEERRLTIVGVDEADAAQGCVAFTAPIARAVTGKKVGQKAPLRTVRGEEVLEVVAVSYEAE